MGTSTTQNSILQIPISYFALFKAEQRETTAKRTVETLVYTNFCMVIYYCDCTINIVTVFSLRPD